MRFAGVFRETSGLISSVHIYFDQVEFMSQLGLMPEPAAS
jgi:hypothetical protein